MSDIQRMGNVLIHGKCVWFPATRYKIFKHSICPTVPGCADEYVLFNTLEDAIRATTSVYYDKFIEKVDGWVMEESKK